MGGLAKRSNKSWSNQEFVVRLLGRQNDHKWKYWSLDLATYDCLPLVVPGLICEELAVRIGGLVASESRPVLN